MTADVKTSDGRARRWDEHRAQRRAEFVAAAVAAIEEHGPDASVGAMAHQAGVGRSVLYRYFTEKTDLEDAVAGRVVDDLLAAVAPTLRVDGTLAESIARAVDAYLDWLLAHPNLHRFLRRHAAATTRVQATVVARVADLTQRALARSGEAPGGVAPLIAAGVIGMSDATIGRWLDDPAGVDRAAATGLLVAMIDAASAAVLAPSPVRRTA